MSQKRDYRGDVGGLMEQIWKIIDFSFGNIKAKEPVDHTQGPQVYGIIPDVWKPFIYSEVQVRGLTSVHETAVGI